MPVKCVIGLCLFGLLGGVSFSQSQSLSARVVFYNVENLFDPYDDPRTMDEEYMPNSPRRWTYHRMEEKLNGICRVLLYAGEWDPPVVVGLSEIECAGVLEDLIWKTGLNHLNYHLIHFSSPDERGIDVALLYRNDRFRVLASHPVEVALNRGARPTRDILYVCGVLDGVDTLHVMVNHWPSRYGGEVVSAPKRLVAANVLKQICDSVCAINPKAKIVVMGDFNDEPEDQSLLRLTDGDLASAYELINLAFKCEKTVPGTLKYKDQWSVFDQIIVSKFLLTDSMRWHVSPGVMKILAADFLLEKDPNYPGVRPWRTYRGYQYAGGYSDHLPVMIQLAHP